MLIEVANVLIYIDIVRKNPHKNVMKTTFPSPFEDGSIYYVVVHITAVCIINNIYGQLLTVMVKLMVVGFTEYPHFQSPEESHRFKQNQQVCWYFRLYLSFWTWSTPSAKIVQYSCIYCWLGSYFYFENTCFSRSGTLWNFHRKLGYS